MQKALGFSFVRVFSSLLPQVWSYGMEKTNMRDHAGSGLSLPVLLLLLLLLLLLPLLLFVVVVAVLGGYACGGR